MHGDGQMWGSIDKRADYLRRPESEKPGEAAMSVERHVKLFRIGRDQAVRIPREFALPGGEAILRKEANRLILEPVRPKSLLALLATLKPLDEEMPEIGDPPPKPFLF